MPHKDRIAGSMATGGALADANLDIWCCGAVRAAEHGDSCQSDAARFVCRARNREPKLAKDGIND